MNATLTTRTDKDFYLATEPITAVSTIQNGSFGIEGGSLRVAVSRVGSLPTDAVFEDPVGVAAAPDGSFYVADAGNFRIARFNSTGKFFKLWGSYGSGNGQFETIICIAVGPDGSVYVGDTSNWILRVQKFDGNGRFITKWSWDGGGYLDHPFGIAVGPDGSVYVADQANNRIRKLGDDGNFVSAWGNYGSGDGQFFLPTGIAVGSDGFVYVADTNNNRIQKFDNNGNFISKWGSYGEGDGQFYDPYSITVAPDGSIYVADQGYYTWGWQHRIQKFDSNGNFIAKWLDYGSGDGSSNIALALSGSVYVTDTYYNQINVFDNNGNFVYSIQELVPEILFETTVPINQPGNTTQDHTANIETLSVAGPLYLQASLFNSLGQIIGQDNYPFFRGEPLSVISVIPNMGLNDVSVNTVVTVQFSKPVDLTTVNSISLSLTETASGTSVSGTLSSDFGDRLVVFRPNSNLILNTTYSLSITTAIKSADGIPLNQAFTGSFKTAGLADSVSPGVSVIPQNGAIEVPVNARIVFGFSEPMNPLTINLSTVGVTNNGTPVSGNITVSQQNTAATFTPGSSFLPNSLVDVTLSHKVTDLAGNPIVGSSGPGTDFMSSFSTANAADSVPPQVLNINPPNGATGIDISTGVSVTFSEPINPITVNNASFVVSVGGTPYPGLISFSGQNTVVTFTPDQPFPTNSLVTVTLSAGISDVAGNGMSSPFTSTFTTYQKGPILTIGYSGATTLTIGDTISVEVANAGDIETTSTYMVKLSDANGLVIYQNTIIEVIQAGASKIYSFQIPNQAADGDYLLYAEAIDSRGTKTAASFAIKILGVKATLNSRTDKEVYLSGKSITGITTLSNGPYGIEGGTLKLAVTKIRDPGTGQFSLFLPKSGWLPFNNSQGIATTFEGLLYVADTGNHRILKFDANTACIAKWGRSGTGNGEFNSPSGIAIGPDGSVYVADTGNHRIQRFDSNGNFITKWGSFGSGPGQFNSPSDVAVGSDGSVYVVDTGNHRIQKFGSDGAFITTWGSFGFGFGTFSSPSGIAIAFDFDFYAETIYIADTENRLIQKFWNDGYFMDQWETYIGTGGFPWGGESYNPRGIAIETSYGPFGSEQNVYTTEGNRIIKHDSNGNFIAEWYFGGHGSPGHYGVALGSFGEIYVADGNQHIRRFDNLGTPLLAIGAGGGVADGEFNWPNSVAVGPDHSIYVADYSNHRIQKFDRTGTFVLKWGNYGTGDGQFRWPSDVAIGPDSSIYVAESSRIQRFDGSGNFITKWGSNGTGDGQFNSISGISVGVDGSVYVTEYSNHRIQKFDSSGGFLLKWGAYGTGDGQFRYPSGISVGPDGLIYVADSSNNRIQKFDTNGNFAGKWGSYGYGDGQLSWPSAITVGPDGSVYVLDSRIQRFDANGGFLARWGTYGSGDGQFLGPSGIAVGSDGSVYVADQGNHRIQKMVLGEIAQLFFEATDPINESANSTQDFLKSIGILNTTGKLFLQTMLANSLSQPLAQSEYPFYIFSGDIALFLNTDKKVYSSGETMTITGRVENRGTTDAANLVLTFQSKLVGQSSQSLYTDTFDLPAGGSHPFTVTTSAGTVGTVILTGTVSQNSSTLVEIKDQCQVVNP